MATYYPDYYGMVIEDLRRKRAAIQQAIETIEALRPEPKVAILDISRSPTMRAIFENWRRYNSATFTAKNGTASVSESSPAPLE